MLVRMTMCPDMNFQEDMTTEITINSDVIGAFIPIREMGPISNKPYVVCYEVFFIQGFALASMGRNFVTVEEKEKVEKLLKPRGGLRQNLEM